MSGKSTREGGPSFDDGVNRSEMLRERFLGSIPEKRKEAILKKAEVLSPFAEEIWRKFGHKQKWTNEAHIDTNRTVNSPDDESLYARKDAKCEDCGYDMWFIVSEVETLIHGGHHQCEKGG